MDDLHSLLKRQLHRCFGTLQDFPAALEPLIAMVNDSYRQSDDDRKMLEHSLDLTSQELMNINADNRAVLEGLIDIYLRVDEQGVVQYFRSSPRTRLVSEGTADMTGRTLGDVLSPTAETALRDALGAVITDGSITRIEYYEAGPPERYVEAWLGLLHNRQIGVMIRDITESRTAAQREQDLQLRLARSQRMESLGLLAGGVAHDLNNILSPLVAYPDMILETIDAANPARRLIQQMQQSAVRASSIIQDLLALARRGNFSPEPVDLNKLVGNYLRTADFHVIKNRFPRVAFSSSLAPELPPIEASANYVSQIVMNLAINAFEAVEAEGRVMIITDAVQTGENQGVYDVIPPGHYVRLRVIDDGIGMSRDQLDRIFEPFYTLKRTGNSGTGLGLTVVYGSVKDCRGYIDVLSAPGKGSEFIVYFPASKKPLPAPAPVRKEDLRGSARILVVDDVAEQRALVGHLLSHLGYHVDAAMSGREAVERCQREVYDLLLLDMILGDGMDGLDTFHGVRAIRPDQRCLIVSGFSENERVHAAIASGALGYVQKPYTLESLGRMVRQALVQPGTIG
jgi:two-component system cell cycle sensor histidine kinase/response regulator CckA